MQLFFIINSGVDCLYVVYTVICLNFFSRTPSSTATTPTFPIIAVANKYITISGEMYGTV